MPSDAAVPRVFPDAGWANREVLVVGLGEVGLAAVDALHHVGATVTGVDSRDVTPEFEERLDIFRYLGVDLHHGTNVSLDADLFDLLVVAEDWMAESSLVAQALERGATVWSEVELAWQIRRAESAPWLVVAGTAGGSQVSLVLEQILWSAGVRACAVGNGQASLLDAVMDPDGPAALIVELSETHLRWPTSFSPVSVVSLDAMTDESLVNPFSRTQAACVYNVQNVPSMRLVEEADVVEGARAVGVSAVAPKLGEIGVVENIVADRAFGPDPRHEADELFTLEDLGDLPIKTIMSALGASAVARSVGVGADAVKAGIRAFSNTRL